MKIGISLPNNWGVREARRLVDAAVRAEEGGLASVWTSEHLINLAYVRARIGNGPYYHPLAVLSAVASRTTRIELGTSIIILPFHNPFDLAKYIATLDQMSEGRVVLGVGVGNIQEEFDVIGVPWKRRGALTDESLAVIRNLWTEDLSNHAGATWQFSDVCTYPKPFGNRRIPITVGGMSDAAMKRAAKFADGWQPTGISPDDLKASLDQLDESLAAECRTRRDMEISFRCNVTLDDAAVTEAELRSSIAGGDVERMIDVGQSYRDAGADHFIFALNASDPDRLDAEIDLISTKVVPRLA